MVESALAKGDQAVRDLTIQQVTSLINKDAKPADAEAFIMFCQSADLNPFTKEVHLVYYGGQPSIVVDVSGVIKHAAMNSEYQYFDSGVIVITADNAPVFRSGSFIYPGDTLAGGWCDVHIAGKDGPILC